MKKIVMALSLVGMLVGPVAGVRADGYWQHKKAAKKQKKLRKKALDNDLVVLRQNRMDDSALIAGQTILGFTALASLAITGLAGVATYQENGSRAFLGTVTALAGVTSATLTYFWHKVLKKRAKRHGEKSVLAFYVKDGLARYPRFILREFLVRHR